MRAVWDHGILLLFEQQVLLARFAKVKAVTDLLPSLRDPQAEYILLRGCRAFTKIGYCL